MGNTRYRKIRTKVKAAMSRRRTAVIRLLRLAVRAGELTEGQGQSLSDAWDKLPASTARAAYRSVVAELGREPPFTIDDLDGKTCPVPGDFGDDAAAGDPIDIDMTAINAPKGLATDD